MKFKDLYVSNKEAVRKALTAMWCSNPRDDMQKAYAEQIKALIQNELFATESAMPLVQSMAKYEQVQSVTREEADNLVGGLWTRKVSTEFSPYEHQYQAWKALTNTDGPKKSMVVTTGTGSGKTECFMLPLVHDLIEHNRDKRENTIQAIFLYPLNALMEDQKDRLQKLLQGTNLTFAVYNGNMPTDEGSLDGNEQERARYDRVCKERKDYPSIIATRNEMYATNGRVPNILLTNPTMLEYMLLRVKDQRLFTPQSLRWVVIDETHTFNGAGAAELSMLLRRVVDAFKLSATDIRFATSSATIGNASTPEEVNENNEKLRTFISDITNVPKEQVVLITGKKKPETADGANSDFAFCQQKLLLNDYVKLNELFPDANESIEEKLGKLDELCEQGLLAKVHYFNRVPNNGLFVQLDDYYKEGVLKVKSERTITDKKHENTPFLELMRCKHCGTYFAVGQKTSGPDNTYEAITHNNSDIFDFSEHKADTHRLIFSHTNKDILEDDKSGNLLVDINANTFEEEDFNQNAGKWYVVLNTKNTCPHCQKKLVKEYSKDNKNEEVNEDTPNAEDSEYGMSSFRLPATFISRLIAPSILKQLKTNENENGHLIPHHGQQYISFVDSRQAAARATMQQNLEEEKMWVYSRLFHALNDKKLHCHLSEGDTQKLEKQRKLLTVLSGNTNCEDLISEAQKEIEAIEAKANDTNISWTEVYRILLDSPESEWLAFQFINKRENNQDNEVGNEGIINEETKNKYILSVMIELLGKRPLYAPAPETMGLWTTTFPKLNNITEVPQAVKDFSEKINLDEWKNLLKIYLDNVVRSNQSVYLEMEGLNYLDIFKCCQRFETKKSDRRPVIKPLINPNVNNGKYPKIAYLLATLLPNDENKKPNEIIKENHERINKVFDCLWENLTVTSHLLQPSRSLEKNSDRWTTDPDSFRLNLADVSFKLIEQACLCDVSRGNAERILRPVDTLFMGLCPYVKSTSVQKPATDIETWPPFPYINGKKENDELVSNEDILTWAKENRSILFDNNLWGEDGEFSDRLNDIYRYPEIFIQAEHTAQVDKLIAKSNQEDFKDNHKINILACSTTMEMGVDIGDLELVLMTSIPPHPTNYKQRAGRSGRNDVCRSACITLCNSDAVGLRTLKDPMAQIIHRPMAVPFVDLQSMPVIQRHVNAFLFRSSGIFFEEVNTNNNNLGQEVINFFTPFFFDRDEVNQTYTIRKDNGDEVYPSDGLGDYSETPTRYHRFIDYLNRPLGTELGDNLKNILKGTCFESCENACIERCKADMNTVYDILNDRISEIKEAYEVELKTRAQGNGNNQVIGNRLNTGYGYVLRHKYSECLSQNMIMFLATHRFTPNANMPVEIIDFNVNLKGESSNSFQMKGFNNPSYVLNEALSQYAPGNTIVLENRTYVVRGLQYTGQFKQTQNFKTLYTDGNTTVIDFQDKLKNPDDARKWSVTGKKEMRFVQPVSFIPDINEENSRIINKNIYTKVSAQLIGTGEWVGNESKLIAVRNNRKDCNAKILYYNEGIGYGYCFCTKCGKMVLENKVAGKYDIPLEMQNEIEESENHEPRYFHYRIDRLNGRNKIECGSRRNILRNIIIGDLIQTDFCEIKIKKEINSNWLDRTADNEKLIITLGILFTRAFTELIGKERKDVDFTITPNGHLVLFDTNPGGSEYSNMLVNRQILLDVIKASLKNVSEASSKEFILDRYSNRYLEELDIEGAKKWLENVLASLESVPSYIKELYNDKEVRTAVVEDIIHDFQKSANNNQEKILFVNNKWNKWFYQTGNDTAEELEYGLHHRWKAFKRMDCQNLKVCIVEGNRIPTPIYRMLMKISDWANLVSTTDTMPDKLSPLAFVNGHLYFTNDIESTNANYDWACSNVFCVSDNEYHPTFTEIDAYYTPAFCIKKTINTQETEHIHSKDIPKIIERIVVENNERIFNDFQSYCIENPGLEMTVVYQDEHLKSALGIVAALQFIEYYGKKFNIPYDLTFVNEEYSEGDRDYKFMQNIANSTERNQFLKDYVDEWREQAPCLCEAYDINPKKPKELPHWREFRFIYGDKELDFYPNGGIINEWYFDVETAKREHVKKYDISNLTVQDNVPLYRRHPIMYDVELKDKEQ